MSVRGKISGLLVLGLILLGSGCGRNDALTPGAEVDDPGYREGKQLEKQGRMQEALAAYLKVIEKRGDRASAESHLEVGLIFKRDIKDPIEAIHHFRKYLEQQPNTRLAPMVRQQLADAQRQFASTLPAQPLESQVARLDGYDQIERLQRENDQLKAELAGLRGVGEPARATNMVRANVGEAIDSRPAPSNPPPVEETSPITLAPIQAREMEPPVTQVQTPPTPPLPAGTRVAPTKPAAATGSGRTYTVGTKETLWVVATKAYGTANNARVRAIADANRDLLPNGKDTPLQTGMRLKIP